MPKSPYHPLGTLAPSMVDLSPLTSPEPGARLFRCFSYIYTPIAIHLARDLALSLTLCPYILTLTPLYPITPSQPQHPQPQRTPNAQPQHGNPSIPYCDATPDQVRRSAARQALSLAKHARCEASEAAPVPIRWVPSIQCAQGERSLHRCGLSRAGERRGGLGGLFFSFSRGHISVDTHFQELTAHPWRPNGAFSISEGFSIKLAG